MNAEELRNHFELVVGDSVHAYRQEYAGAPIKEDGYSDEYVHWLEQKLLQSQPKQLSDEDIEHISIVVSSHTSEEIQRISQQKIRVALSKANEIFQDITGGGVDESLIGKLSLNYLPTLEEMTEEEAFILERRVEDFEAGVKATLDYLTQRNQQKKG